MKQKDIAVILVVIFVGAIVSFGFTKFIFGSDKKDLKAEKVDKISSKFDPPDNKVFNSNAVNPAQLILVGESTGGTAF